MSVSNLDRDYLWTGQQNQLKYIFPIFLPQPGTRRAGLRANKLAFKTTIDLEVGFILDNFESD